MHMHMKTLQGLVQSLRMSTAATCWRCCVVMRIMRTRVALLPVPGGGVSKLLVSLHASQCPECTMRMTKTPRVRTALSQRIAINHLYSRFRHNERAPDWTHEYALIQTQGGKLTGKQICNY